MDPKNIVDETSASNADPTPATPKQADTPPSAISDKPSSRRKRSDFGTRDTSNQPASSPRYPRPLMGMLSSFSRTSHGRPGSSGTYFMPAKTEVRNNSVVVDAGLMLDQSIFARLREDMVNVPATLAVFLYHPEQLPVFAELQPKVDPSLAMALHSLAIRRLQEGRVDDIDELITKLADEYGIEASVAKLLMENARTFLDKVLATGQNAAIARVLTDQSGVTNPYGAFLQPLRVPFSTFERSFDMLQRVHGSLTLQVPLETISAELLTMTSDPVYAMIYEMVAAIQTYRLPSIPISAYALLQLRAAVGHSTALPQATRVELSEDDLANMRPLAGSFGMRKGDADLPPVSQYKFWEIDDPMAGRVDIRAFASAVARHDQLMFGFPAMDIDLHRAVEAEIFRGKASVIPRGDMGYDEPVLDFYDSPYFQEFIGLTILQNLRADSGSSLSSELNGRIKEYRRTDTNGPVTHPVYIAVQTLRIIIEAFSAFRNSCWRLLNSDDANQISHRVINGIDPALSKGVMIPSIVLETWRAHYNRALELAAALPSSPADGTYLSHPSRIQTLKPSIEFDLLGAGSRVSHALIPQPQFRVSPDGGQVVVETALHTLSGNDVVYASSGCVTPVHARFTHPASLQPMNTLRSGTLAHSLVHVYEDTMEIGMNPEFQNLVRFIPSPVHMQMEASGHLESVIQRGTYRPSVKSIVAWLITRLYSARAMDLGLASLRAAILGTGLGILDDAPKTFESSAIGSLYLGDLLRYRVRGSIQYGKSQISAIEVASPFFYDCNSANLMFVHRFQNALSVEDSDNVQRPLHAPFPLFAMHVNSVIPSALTPRELISPLGPDDVPADTLLSLFAPTIVVQPLAPFGDNRAGASDTVGGPINSVSIQTVNSKFE